MGLQSIGNAGNVKNDTIYRYKCDTIYYEREDGKGDSIVFKTWCDTIYYKPEDTIYCPDEAFRIVSDMHKAIGGLGTDDKLFEKVLNSVDESNYERVWTLWKDTYGKEYGENFYESFMNDADSKQKATFSEKLQNLFKKYLQPEK